MNGLTPSRPALTLVQGTQSEAPVEYIWFCGHCAAPAPGGAAPAPVARVCNSCGLGLMLETRSEIVPDKRDAFLVVDSAMLIQGVSRRAEQLLALEEEAAINRPVGELLVAPDAEAGAPGSFAAAIADAVAGDEGLVTKFVRPWNTFGVRMRARIGACGPPRAALIVLDDSPAPLRAVGSR
jgi:PAS domain-containing protein